MKKTMSLTVIIMVSLLGLTIGAAGASDVKITALGTHDNELIKPKAVIPTRAN